MANEKKIISRFQFRRDTTENWLLNKDITPAAGEPCYDIDLKTLKIGDGKTTYENLPVLGNSEGADTSAIQAEIAAIKDLMETLQEDIDNVEINVSDIQDQVGETNIVEITNSVTQINENVNNLTTQIETTNNEIVTIQETLETKADAEIVTELQTVIEQKVDTEAVEILKTDLQTYVDEQLKIFENIDDGEI